MCRAGQRQDTLEQQLFTPSLYTLPAPGNHRTTEAPTAGSLYGLQVPSFSACACACASVCVCVCVRVWCACVVCV
jgi:hypothetical protein